MLNIFPGYQRLFFHVCFLFDVYTSKGVQYRAYYEKISLPMKETSFCTLKFILDDGGRHYLEILRRRS